MCQEDWDVENVGHSALRRFRNVVAEMVRVTVFVGYLVFDEPGDRICILHALEGPGGRFKVRVEFFHVSGNAWICECEFDDAADDCLDMLEQVVESDEIELRFDVCIFG